MSWEIFSIIGTIAFAISGAVVAIEEEYDILGVLILGFVTAFGGGIMRNLLIDLPMASLWSQELAIDIALICVVLAFLLPKRWIDQAKSWIDFFDAIGLAAFSIQGALITAHMHYGVITCTVAAVLTGAGGGMLRDVLARRKPLLMREEVYGFWAILAGILIGAGFVQSPYQLYTIFVFLVMFRMLSLRYHWRLPRKTY